MTLRTRKASGAAVAVSAAVALVAGLLGLAAPSAAQAEVKPAAIVTGWFGWWAKDSEVQTLIDEADGVVGEVNIFWWTFAGAANPVCVISTSTGVCDPSGATPWTTTKFDGQRRMLQDAGIKVFGSITDLGSTYAGQLSPYLADAKNRRDYARKIARYAKNAGVDGVDLDWENFAFRDRNLGISWAETRPRWIAMMKRLSRELHEVGLELSLTIPGGEAYWGGSDGVYALAEVIDFADQVRFMTYDYSWNVPGPIGPTGWARAQLEAAIAEVGQSNAAKLWVGNPQYGRQWVVNQGSYSAPVYGIDDRCPSGWTPGYYSTSGSWIATTMQNVGTSAGAEAIAQARGVTPQWNSTHGEWSFTYTTELNGRFTKKGQQVERECTVEREVWFGDTRSALTDAAMVPDLGIAGIAVWNLASAQSDFYPRMASYGREVAPAPTELSVTASSAVTFGRDAKITVATSSDKGPAAGAKVTVLWSPTVDGAVDAVEAKAESVAQGTLDADGKATFAVPVERTGYFWVEVAATSQHTAGSSDPVRTRVRWQVVPQERAYTTVTRQPVALAAGILPGIEGVKVRVQKRTSSGWKTLRVLPTDSSGGVSTNVRVLKPKTVTYRFVAGNAEGLVRGVSPKVTLEVTAG
jgi:spore germination protein YaaH